MRLLEIYSTLKKLNLPVIKTRDVAALLNIKLASASKILARLAKNHQIIYLHRGLWAIPELIDPLILPQYLTAPFPCYISLQSALYYHGMISQIPTTIYAVSLARTKKFITPLGSVSIHHVQPDFFFGFETTGKQHIKIATPEKALIDIFYLSTAKSRLFSSLPEVEFPKNFSIKKAYDIIKKIKSKTKKALVAKLFAKIIK